LKSRIEDSRVSAPGYGIVLQGGTEEESWMTIRQEMMKLSREAVGGQKVERLPRAMVTGREREREREREPKNELKKEGENEDGGVEAKVNAEKERQEK